MVTNAVRQGGVKWCIVTTGRKKWGQPAGEIGKGQSGTSRVNLGGGGGRERKVHHFLTHIKRSPLWSNIHTQAGVFMTSDQPAVQDELISHSWLSYFVTVSSHHQIFYEIFIKCQVVSSLVLESNASSSKWPCISRVGWLHGFCFSVKTIQRKPAHKITK